MYTVKVILVWIDLRETNSKKLKDLEWENIENKCFPFLEYIRV